MKLVQYRFPHDSLSNSASIGLELQSFFRGHGETKVNFIYSSPLDKHGVVRTLGSIEDLASIASESFVASFSDTVDYENTASIKSLNSCRFIVFEDDGLLRVCYSNDDDVIKFDGLGGEMEDVSNLLVDTDLFDYL